MPKVSIEELNVEQIDRLKRHGWSVDYWNSSDNFRVYDADGSSIKNSVKSLEFLLDELKDLDMEDEPVKQISDEQVLQMNGYHVLCQSPFEIGSDSDPTVMITGWAAKTLVSGLKAEHYKS